MRGCVPPMAASRDPASGSPLARTCWNLICKGDSFEMRGFLYGQRVNWMKHKKHNYFVIRSRISFRLFYCSQVYCWLLFSGRNMVEYGRLFANEMLVRITLLFVFEGFIAYDAFWQYFCVSVCLRHLSLEGNLWGSLILNVFLSWFLFRFVRDPYGKWF